MTPEEEATFQEEIGQRHDPAKQALDELAAYQESVGMVFDDPDKPVPPDAKAWRGWKTRRLTATYMGAGRNG